MRKLIIYQINIDSGVEKLFEFKLKEINLMTISVFIVLIDLEKGSVEVYNPSSILN
jgi:hypothetical protein